MNSFRSPKRRVPMALAIAFSSIAIFGASFNASTVDAQSYRAQPVYGTITRVSPFTPDPVIVQVTAGGETNARDLNLGNLCRGFITSAAPLLKLRYEAGRVPLQIWAHSPQDTTLIVRAPDGRWHCDDDSLVKNPAIRFATPQSGEYAIWVGSFGGLRPTANVYITER